MNDFISIPLVAFPLIASMILLAFVSNGNARMRARLVGPIRMACLIFSLLMLALTTGMFFRYFGDVTWMDIGFNEYEFERKYTWVESLGINWAVGLDALSFPMVWLTTFLLPVTIIATWNEKHGATYFPLLLMMGGALIGVFVSLDLFMFYVFWELTLIPMFFLILKMGW